MKNERLLDALEKIDEELIIEAAPGNKPPKKTNNRVWMKWGAMAACVLLIVGVTRPYMNKYGGQAEEAESESFVVSEEGKLENNVINDVTSDTSERNVAGEGGANLETLQRMEEIKIKIDEMLPDGFIGTIEVGNDLFKAGEQITIIAQDNISVVQKDGSIFDYDELEPNIPDSNLAIGSSVWVGFQKFDYVVGNGKYNQIFAYHVVERDESYATDNEPMEELTLEEAVSDAKFGNLFPATILDGYVLQDTVAVLNDTVLVANFYNEALSDELTIRIASQEWFYNQKKDLVQNTVMYREKDGASYIYIAGGENIVQYTFSKTDIADNEKFYDMVYSASYFDECIDYPDNDISE